MNYKDASLSIEERVEDLLGRMTLDEMAAQLGSYWIYQLDDGKNLSHEKAQRLLHDGIGQITRVRRRRWRTRSKSIWWRKPGLEFRR